MDTTKKSIQYAVFATFKTTGRTSEMTLPMNKDEAKKAITILKEKSKEFKKLNFYGFKIKPVLPPDTNYN